MQNTHIICIDLGSAYTKVAIRRDLNKPTQLAREIPIAERDISFCVPSVVARVERLGGPQWIIGQEAAEQRAGDGVVIYRHWKSQLFSERTVEQDMKYSPGPKDSVILGAGELKDVGVRFFKELKGSLESMDLNLDIGNCPLRICIPSLRENPSASKTIIGILSDAGWNTAENNPTVYEPESNVIGVFTRGENATWMPKPGRIDIDYQGMFESKSILSRYRKSLPDHEFRYGVLVVDIGDFTTDFGYVEFNDHLFDKRIQRPQIIQLSRKVGIQELDLAVRERMRPEVQEAIPRISTSEWENAKRTLYLHVA